MKHVPLDVWRRFNERVGARLRLGEWLDGDPASLARAWRDGGFTAMFDFPLAFAAADVFCKGADVRRLGVALTEDRRMPDPARLVTLLDNHDLPRIAGVCGGRLEPVKDAWAFLFTARGIPSITWGDEVGEDGVKEPDNRRDLRFDERHPLRGWLKDWLALRKAHPALADGSSVLLAATASQLVVGRTHPDELALVTLGDATLPALPPGWSRRPWRRAPLASARVAVWLAPGDAALHAEASRQWRSGARTRTVHVDGERGTFLVGSGPELGDWKPSRRLPLPADVVLPVGGLFAFKRVRFDGERAVWPDGPDELLFVDER